MENVNISTLGNLSDILTGNQLGFLDTSLLLAILFVLAAILAILSWRKRAHKVRHNPLAQEQLTELTDRLRDLSQYVAEDKVYGVIEVLRGEAPHPHGTQAAKYRGISVDSLCAALSNTLGDQPLLLATAYTINKVKHELSAVQRVRMYAHDGGFNDTFTTVFCAAPVVRYQLSRELSQLAAQIEREFSDHQSVHSRITLTHIPTYS